MVSIKSPSRPTWLGDGLVVQSELGAGGGGAGGGNPPFADTIGDGVATSFVVNHNLGSRDVVVSVYENSAPYTQVFPRIEHTDINNVTVLFDSPPDSGSRRVVVAYASFVTADAGTLASRPAATAVPEGSLYFVTDDDEGTLYRSDGAEWDQVAFGVGQPAVVDSGTLAERPAPEAVPTGTVYFVTDDDGGTLFAAGGVVWVQLAPGVAEAATGGAEPTPPYAQTVGNGVATSFVITHNLASRDVIVQVYDTASPYGEVLVGVERTTANSVTVIFDTPPATNSRRVVVAYASANSESELAYGEQTSNYAQTGTTPLAISALRITVPADIAYYLEWFGMPYPSANGSVFIDIYDFNTNALVRSAEYFEYSLAKVPTTYRWRMQPEAANRTLEVRIRSNSGSVTANVGASANTPSYLAAIRR